MVTRLKRTLFERRDFLSLLLAASARIFDDNDDNDGVTANCSQHARIVQRLVKTFQTTTTNNNNEDEEDGGSFTILSTANELKSILIALAEECHTSIRTNVVGGDGGLSLLPTKKRARVNSIPIHNNNNNLHSILKFVQRVTCKRYQKKQQPSRHHIITNEDEYYLEDEMRLFFGKKDLLFQIDEDILALAFKIAFDTIIIHRNLDLVNNASKSITTTTTTTTVGNAINAENFIQISQHYDQINNNNNDNNIINTALQIIDSSVLASRCMRVKLVRLHQLQQQRTVISFTTTAATTTTADTTTTVNTNKRMKYDHLLNPIINQNDEDDEEEDDDGIGCTGVTISVCEERYPQQWQWLHQFRLKLEEVQKKATLLSASSSSSSNKSDAAITETSVNETNNFVIVRRKIEILDDILLAFSDDDSSSDEEQNQECSLKASSATATFESQTVIVPEQSEGDYAAAAASSEQSTLSVLAKSTSSPLNDIDRETRQLQLVLLAMPPSESASTEVVRHTVNKIVSLLSRYVELDGTTGIKRCGDILGRCYTYATDSTDPTIIDKDDNKSSHRGSISNMNRFPLTEAMSSSLVSAYLTDATGALRVKTFLHSFILPLMMELNPSIRSTNSGGLDVIKANNDLGKPASRVLISLLSSLARERPMECVASILVPSLVMTTTKYTLFEPNRFQCELISRVLRGKDALNSQAIAFLVSELLPTKEELNTLTISYSSSLIGGMKWTENTMPILTACLIGQLTLSDDAVMTLSGMISYQLSSNVKSSSTLMAKSIKFSTLFQTFVAKYGSQVKSIHKVESLLDSATRLKTFMSKTICLSLKKLM